MFDGVVVCSKYCGGTAAVSVAVGIAVFVGVGVFDDLSRYLAESVSLIRGEGLTGFSIFSYNALADRRFPHQFLNEALFESAIEPE